MRKGDIVKIRRVISDQEPVHVTRMENVATSENYTSSDDGTIMTVMPKDLDQLIEGRILSASIGGNNVTNFTIEEGTLTPDHVFVTAGEKGKGQKALTEILGRSLDTYLKVEDAYLSSATLMLLSTAPTNIDMLILTDTIKDEEAVKQEASKLKNKITIKKNEVLHDRFLITRGCGWSVGHSLKDFGARDSHLERMPSWTEEENRFDDLWNQSRLVFAKDRTA